MHKESQEMSAEALIEADQAARSRALDPYSSFIVDAPAGAGKTELLTQRFLALLARVSEPEEVVALTFTRKAAAEMRDRVMSNLRKASNFLDSNAPEHSRTTYALARAVLDHNDRQGWQLLTNPGRLRIMTLDAISMHLARQMPLLSRFGSQPALSTECQPLYEQAVRETLALLNAPEGNEDGDTIARVLAYFDNDTHRLQKMLVAMLGRRDQWQGYTFGTKHHETLQQAVSNVLAGLISSELSSIANSLEPIFSCEVMAAARHAASNSPDAPIHLLQDWDCPPPTDATGLPRWRAIAALFLTGSGSLRKDYRSPINLAGPANKAQKDTLKAALIELAQHRLDAVLQRIRELPDPRLSEDESGIVCDMARMLQLAIANLWLLFIREKTVDHTEIAQRALAALGDHEAPTDLAQQLDYQIRHLLVDEFQDTSPTQVSLLEKLTAGWSDEEGQTLFLVGDPMQSIYRFRKADVGLFIRVRQDGIGHIRPTPLRLYRNYRSTSAIVSWVNQTFEHVFADKDDAMRGAVRFSPAVAHRETREEISVHIHPIITGSAQADDDDNSIEVQTPADQREAQVMLQLIRQTRIEKPDATIAILVRARSHLNALVSLLNTQTPRIPFQAVEIDPLVDRQPIQDLVSLTRALHHQADRIHWLAILRAPWCGLRLEDLHHLAADDHDQTLWALMQEDTRITSLTPDGRSRLCHLRQVISRAYDKRSLFRPRRWIEHVWRALGGHLTLEAPSDIADVQAYFKLLDTLEAQGSLDLNRLDDGLNRLFAAADASTDSARIQLMTIHKSKGLQFDTVIIPGMHKRLPTDDKALLLWDTVLLDDDHEHLVVAPIAPLASHTNGIPTAYDLLRNLEKTRSLNEAQRVLYVGITRAERQLHLLGVAQRDSKPGGNTGLRSPASTSLLAPLWPALENNFMAAIDSESPLPQKSIIQPDASEFVPQLVRLNEAYTFAYTDIAEFCAAFEDTPPSGQDETLEMSIGTLTHRYLEAIANDGIEAWSARRIAHLHATVVRTLCQQGHSVPDADIAAKQIIHTVTTMLESDTGRWILKPRTVAANEIPMSSLHPDAPSLFQHHIIDRMFIDDGIRWIIDYKTFYSGDTVTQAQLRSRAFSYQTQLERYAALFANDPLKTRTAIYFPAHDTLIEVPTGTKEQ